MSMHWAFAEQLNLTWTGSSEPNVTVVNQWPKLISANCNMTFWETLSGQWWRGRLKWIVSSSGASASLCMALWPPLMIWIDSELACISFKLHSCSKHWSLPCPGQTLLYSLALLLQSNVYVHQNKQGSRLQPFFDIEQLKCITRHTMRLANIPVFIKLYHHHISCSFLIFPSPGGRGEWVRQRD